jgi:hypothetical protein
MDKIDIAIIRKIAYSGEEKIDFMCNNLILNNTRKELNQFNEEYYGPDRYC